MARYVPVLYARPLQAALYGTVSGYSSTVRMVGVVVARLLDDDFRQWVETL